MNASFLQNKIFYLGYSFLLLIASSWSNATCQPTYKAEKINKDLYLKEIPVLCYHKVRDYKAGDTKTARSYIVPEQQFMSQIKMLHDSGYHPILPAHIQ
jgi:hypothetical protein